MKPMEKAGRLLQRIGAAAVLVLAACSGSGMNQGEMPGASMNRGEMQGMMAQWDPASREAAMFMMEKYGPPAGMTPRMAIWHQTGPWKRTIVYAEAVPHSFPAPHPDVMEQFIEYKVPPAMYDDLAMYDGSVVVARTTGEISARCDKEGANFLALNLAHEVATGRLTVEAARRRYGEEIMAMKAGRPTDYTQRLLFSPMPGGSMDPDRPLM